MHLQTVSLGFASYNLLGRMIVTGHPHDAKVQVPKGLQPDLPLTGRMLFLRPSQPKKTAGSRFQGSQYIQKWVVGWHGNIKEPVSNAQGSDLS